MTNEEFIKKYIKQLYSHSEYSSREETIIEMAMNALLIFQEKETKNFAEYLSDSGWRKISKEDWSNGEVHKTTSELFEIFQELV